MRRNIPCYVKVVTAELGAVLRTQRVERLT